MKTKLLMTCACLMMNITSANAVVLSKDELTIQPSVDFVGNFSLTGTDLHFGVVMNPNNGQKVTVDSGGHANVSNGARLLSSSMVRAGSVTVIGDIDTLKNNSAVTSILLDMPDNVPLTSGGITCGNVAFDGDIPVTAATTYNYGGELTLSTNQTNIKCSGNGTITLIADIQQAEPPATPEEPEEPEEPEVEYVWDEDLGCYVLTDPETGEKTYYEYNEETGEYVQIDDPTQGGDEPGGDEPGDEPDPGDEPGGDEPGGGWEYPYVNQYLESGEWEALGADIIQQMDNFLLVNNELYTQSQDLYVEKGKDDEHVIISTWEASDQTDFLWRAEYGSASMYGVINAGTGNYQDNGLLLKYDDLDISGYIKISSLGDRNQARTSLLDENAATHITGTTGYLLEIPFERNLYLDTDGLHWAGTGISGRTITESDSVLRLYSGSFEKGDLKLVDEGTYAGLVDKWNH